MPVLYALKYLHCDIFLMHILQPNSHYHKIWFSCLSLLLYIHICLHHVIFVSLINADVKSTFIAVMRIYFWKKKILKQSKTFRCITVMRNWSKTCFIVKKIQHKISTALKTGLCWFKQNITSYFLLILQWNVTKKHSVLIKIRHSLEALNIIQRHLKWNFIYIWHSRSEIPKDIWMCEITITGVSEHPERHECKNTA